MRSKTFKVALSLTATVIGVLAAGATPALAETHPFLSSFGSFSNPNGIAIDEASDDVYVADLGADTVSKFDANGNPVDFTCGTQCATYVKGNEITGSPTGSFSFPEADGTPAAIAVDDSTNPADPSAGDLYVMDVDNDAIDKFNAEGKYLTQITGLSPMGIGVDTNGNLRVLINVINEEAVDVFDDSVTNRLVAAQRDPGMPEGQQGYDFAVGPTGNEYLLYSGCSCVGELGSQLAPLGEVDNKASGDVAVAADPATGHLYADDQSSIAEWDTGAINGSRLINISGTASFETAGVGALISSFDSLQLAGFSGQGGIALNGVTGEIYVSNPETGKVDVFGSVLPAVTVGSATDVTERAAALSGTVNPRGAAITSCKFEYGVTDEESDGAYDSSVPCMQTPGQIGSGTSPVAVSADLEGLQPGLLYHFRLNAGNASGSSPSSGLLATAGLGFGIKSFEVSFVNEDGTPDTQAGSHPYEMVVNMSVNTRYLPFETSGADSRYYRQPDGVLKDVIVDLPPGLVGNPNATAAKCTLAQLDGHRTGSGEMCPAESALGELELEWAKTGYGETYAKPIFNMVPPHGVALQIGADFTAPDLFINNSVRAGGDYPIQATIGNAPPEAAVFASRLRIFGEAGQEGVNKREEAKRRGETLTSEEQDATLKPFLTLPTGCKGPLRSTISADSWLEPGHFSEASSITRNAGGVPVSTTGCSKLIFPPTIEVKPDVDDASSSSGLTVGVHVPQTAAFNPNGLAESSLRDTTVTLPEGVAINPAGAEGLEACSEGLAGFEGFSEFNSEFEPGDKTATFSPTPLEQLQPGASLCPDGSKIGTVKVKTPLLEHELEGAVYLAAQNSNPFGSLVAMYLMVEDPVSGSTIKLTGEVHLTATGQIVTTFDNTPDLPFESLELHFFGGERAPLATPSRCGTYTTQASFVPWNGNGPVNTSSSFQITSGPGGGPCPGASLPFNPSLTGGATNVNAGAFSPFTLTMSRKDGEQNLQSVEAHLPPGLSGILSNIELCPEPQANLGECPANSLIGETTISVGVGNQPYTVSGGKFYLTGPYNGSGPCTVGQLGCAPFGITFEVPAKAGPFDLKRNTANPAGEDPCDCVLVRGKIEVNPITAAITITSNPPGTPDAIPTSIEGIPLEIQHVNAITTRGDFQFNPTNCNKMQVTGTIHSSEGSTDTIGVPFQVTNCAVLKFAPKLAVSTSGKTSRANGASLSVKLTYPKAPFGSQANIKSVKVDLPKQLPSRLTTLQKACPAKTFEANPGGCPAASIVGHATAITPLIPVPLTGPAYFVSYGGAKFPELVVVLQGYGVTLDLHGETFISKAGITSSTFHTVPDAPVGSFELKLPEGKFSALAANGNLCKSKLAMPTAFTAQNGAEIHESTKVGVTGCPKTKKAKKTKVKKAGKHSKKRR